MCIRTVRYTGVGTTAKVCFRKPILGLGVLALAPSFSLITSLTSEKYFNPLGMILSLIFCTGLRINENTEKKAITN